MFCVRLLRVHGAPCCRSPLHEMPELQGEWRVFVVAGSTGCDDSRSLLKLRPVHLKYGPCTPVPIAQPQSPKQMQKYLVIHERQSNLEQDPFETVAPPTHN